VLITGIVLTIVVLLVFAVQTLRTERLTFAILCLAIVLDFIWSRIRARRAAAAG
jgi:hypothetical protein